ATTEQAAQPAAPAKPAEGTEQAAQTHTTSLGEVASTVPIIPQSRKKANNATISGTAGPTTLSAASQKAGGKDPESSPLQFKIGTATIIPVAFMDFTSVYRSKTTNGSIATNFSSVPYASSAGPPNLSEFRLSTENSRIGLRVDADVKG